MTFPEPPENLPSDAAVAEVRSRLVADGVIPGPMPDQTPEPAWPLGDLTPGTYTLTSTGDGPGDAVITDDGRILVEQFEGDWRDLTFVYRSGVSWEFERREPHPAAPDPTRARVAELEAAQANRAEGGVLPPCCREAHLRMVCETDCGNCNVCRFTARITELEREVTQWQGMYRVASDHREQNLNDYQEAAERLAAFLGTETGTRPAAAPQSRCQTTTAIAVWDGVADGRSIWCELPDGHVGKHHATVPQPGNEDATVDWGNPPTERIGYAVGYALDGNYVSLSSDRLYLVPTDAAEELAAAQSEAPATPFHVYELREVRGEDAPSAAPAGYVVVTRNSEGGVHRSATVWDSLEQANTAEGIASGYAEGTGCTAAVYELREVRGE